MQRTGLDRLWHDRGKVPAAQGRSDDTSVREGHIHGANGYSDEYPAGRFYRNAKAAVIYEGTREIHKVMQADYALGYRQDKPRRVELPAFRQEVDAR